jgi:hypothetical protein
VATGHRLRFVRSGLAAAVLVGAFAVCTAALASEEQSVAKPEQKPAAAPEAQKSAAAAKRPAPTAAAAPKDPATAPPARQCPVRPPLVNTIEDIVAVQAKAASPVAEPRAEQAVEWRPAPAPSESDPKSEQPAPR